MKPFYFAFGFFVTICMQAQAEDVAIYKTQKGQIFAKVLKDSFGVAWKSPDGSIWSQYQGFFANRGELGNEIIESGDRVILDSAATQICARIGGGLPSLQQYKVLTDYFLDPTDFRAIFPVPTSASNLFWTVNGQSGFARFVKLSPILDPYGDVMVMGRQLSVMCVRESQ